MRTVPALLGVVWVAGIAGCKIEVVTITAIHPDGSVTRTLRYYASGDRDRSEVETRYELPEGGVWATEPHTWVEDGEEDERPTDFYEVAVIHTARDADSFRDYLRFGDDRSRSSRNAVSVAVREGLLARTYIYEETFRDAASAEAAEEALGEVYELTSRSLAQALRKHLVDRLDSVSSIEEAVRDAFEPHRKRLAHAIRGGGRDIESALEVVENATKEGPFARVLLKKLQTEASDEDWLLPAIRLALDDAGEAVSDADEGLGAAWGEAVFGVHNWMHGYSFRHEVSMPGVIFEHNANELDNGILVWEFDSPYFLWRPYTLRAQSRMILPGRVAQLVFWTLAITSAAFLVARRRAARRQA